MKQGRREEQFAKKALAIDPGKARAELEDGCMGVMMGLNGVPDKLVAALHQAVPERGSALWVRFTAWRDAEGDKGGDAPFTKWVGQIIMKAILG